MGICGYIDLDDKSKDNVILDMTKTLIHGDNSNTNIYMKDSFFIGNTDESNDTVYLKKSFNNTTYIILFNGELYNKEEIKNALIQKGYILSTPSNAELVLIAFYEFEKEVLNMLDGLYSFVIYNEKDKSLFIARDRLGVKPMYYTRTSSAFIFSTRIKSILKHPSVTAKISKEELCELFGLGPAHTPGKTFFKGIYEILPGHYATFENTEFKEYKYWDLETNTFNGSLDDAINNTKTLLENSLTRQLKTNSKTCAMLSGGIDSSILCSLTNGHIEDFHTFSIDFEENMENFSGSSYQPTQDKDFVKIMVEKLKSTHHTLSFNTEDLLNNLKDAVYARDLPGMADVDSSMLVFCKKIKDHNFDIAISGECSDEIFGGYPWYYKEELLKSQNFPWSRGIDIRTSVINDALVSKEELEKYIDNSFKNTVKNVVYNSDDIFENTFRKTCYATIKWFMNTLIERTDRMSLLSGLKVRIPFADYRIFEYIYNVPAKYKLGLVNSSTPTEKYLLRKAFENTLPQEIAFRKKSPFPKTYDPKYTEALENILKEIINKSTSPLLEIVNVKTLYNLLNTHGANLNENWFGQLMTYPQTLAYLIQVNMWLEMYNIEIDV